MGGQDLCSALLQNHYVLHPGEWYSCYISKTTSSSAPNETFCVIYTVPCFYLCRWSCDLEAQSRNSSIHSLWFTDRKYLRKLFEDSFQISALLLYSCDSFWMKCASLWRVLSPELLVFYPVEWVTVIYQFSLVLLLSQSQHSHLVIQQLLGHLDANSKNSATVRAGIVEVLLEAAAIAASGSVGKMSDTPHITHTKKKHNLWHTYTEML